MKKSKIQISATLIDAIVESSLCEKQKCSFLRHVGYLYPHEQQELLQALEK
ncbi:hypothetical protein LAT59_01065 [Candidatus Gracilibacteria bacterium]|nr:hypothetical protein [Candidatus Gracilibacteria bacterium]